MRELNNGQIKQISGGVALGSSNGSTNYLILSPNEFFLLGDIKSKGIYLFKSNGEVSFSKLSSKEWSDPIKVPFEITDNGNCMYSVPSSFFQSV